MNVDYALSRRRDLQIIIKAYEDFLREQLLKSANRMKAAEAFGAKDIVRTIAMSEIAKTRVDRITNPESSGPPSLGTTSQPLIQEASNFGSALRTPDTGDSDKKSQDRLFKDLTDCIPCNLKWSIKDFDWDRLKGILLADLKARLGFLNGLEDLFKGNPILDQLCDLLHRFRDLCPQDLLVLIGILTAFIMRVLDSIDFNLVSALNDILSTLLRPYIGGLEDFLNMYLQFLLDQIDCILNSIENAATSLIGLSVSNDRGPKALHFNKKLTSEQADQNLQDIADTSRSLREKAHEINDSITEAPDDIAAYIRSIGQEAIDWIELKLTKVQDALIDLLGGEWLITQDNISWYEQVKAVATIIDICEVIVKLGLGDGDELCTEENARQIIDQLNNRTPNGTSINIDDAAEINKGSSPRIPGTTSQQLSEPKTSSIAVKQFNFALHNCLKKVSPSEETLMRQWQVELGG
jgi:hypothetical protein